MMNVTPVWPQTVLESLKHSSIADLSGEHIDNLARLGAPKVMRQLDISYVQIATIEGLKVQTNLKTFIADGSSLTNLANFKSIPNVNKISMKNTPVSRDPHFLLSLLIICPGLTVVNGRLITSSMRQKAAKFPPIAKKLIDAGWMAEWPVPSEEDFEELCKQFNVNQEEPKQEEEEEDFNDDIDHIEEYIQEIYDRHARMVEQARRRCGLAEEEEEEEEEEEINEGEQNGQIGEVKKQGSETDTEASEKEFDDSNASTNEPLINRIAAILKENGIELEEGEDLESTVLKVVDSLCAETEQQKIADIDAESLSSNSDEKQE